MTCHNFGRGGFDIDSACTTPDSSRSGRGDPSRESTVVVVVMSCRLPLITTTQHCSLRTGYALIALELRHGQHSLPADATLIPDSRSPSRRSVPRAEALVAQGQGARWA